MKNLPIMTLRTEDDLFVLGRYILKERPNDVSDFNNLVNVFMSGRRVGKIPSSSIDIDENDRVNDFNATDTYFYYVVDVGGSAEWRRMEAQSW